MEAKIRKLGGRYSPNLEGGKSSQPSQRMGD